MNVMQVYAPTQDHDGECCVDNSQEERQFGTKMTVYLRVIQTANFAARWRKFKHMRSAYQTVSSGLNMETLTCRS